MKCVYWFSLKLLSESFFIPRRTERHVIKNVHWCSYKVYVVLVVFNKAVSRQIFGKYSDISFYENPSGGSRVVPCGRTDRKNLTFAFRHFVKAPKKVSLYLVS